MLDGTVLITGGAGFIARAIYRRAEREDWPATFIAFSRDDAKHAALHKRYPHVRIVRGDVTRDPELLRAAMAGVDYVIHAAAAKYVDLSENAAWDTVTVNIDGSRNVAIAAAEAAVDRVVGISTDKACQPVNIYGMSKAVMERLFVEANRWRGGSMFGTSYTCVRYGNVIGSTGSVIPLFRDQADRYGAIKLTDGAMTRFWMAPDEAIDMILIALLDAEAGSIVVRPPSAADMETVAEAASPHVPRQIIGLRPGEKMHEDLVHEQESVRVVSRVVVGEVPWYEVRPPGEIAPGQEPFRFTSSAPAKWLTAAEIREIADDAETI